jgi:hypothetical protein
VPCADDLEVDGAAMSGVTRPLRGAARSVTAPVRNYVNHHFEMVKDEIRRSGGGPVDEATAWQRVAELENALTELSLYEGRLISRLTDEVAGLTARIDDLERVVRQLAAVVGESTDR